MKIKKYLTATCLLVTLLWAATAQADFTYTTSNGQITITGYSGTVPETLEVPATINGLPVVRIDGGANLGGLYGAFKGDTSLNIVALPTTITSLGEGAFYGCSSLSQVYLNGNAPNLEGPDVFTDAGNPFFPAQVYYLFGTTGWSAAYGGLNTQLTYAPVNGSFDDTGDFYGWTVSGNGSAQCAGPNVYSGSYAARFVETASRNGPNGFLIQGSSSVLSQTVPTQAGASYVLSFAVNGMTNGVCSASWNGNTLVSQNFSPGWTNLQFVVTATGAGTVLQFTFPPQYGSQATTAIDSVTLIPMPTITSQTRSGSTMNLTMAGGPNAKYAVERTFNLKPPVNWSPQTTNTTDATGNGGFLTTINPATNNFWRVRYVP
jgi:hypothetical protein